jgi:hypothetical protein
MYRIDKTNNSVHSLEEKTFSPLGFRERPSSRLDRQES